MTVVFRDSMNRNFSGAMQIGPDGVERLFLWQVKKKVYRLFLKM